ncbi:MAG: TonB-dependent receptor [Acidobacteria bacterium]|nr:TonB-dependent receptor [Acidobacteriota bacterium]
MRKTVVLSILALLLVPSLAYGQAQKGNIAVTVEAEDGSRLPGVTVEANADDTLTARTGITDENGVATLTAMDPSRNYVVTTALDGFNGSRNENVLVRAGQTTDIRVSLSLATVTEEVIVTAESPVVDVTSAVAGQEITLELTEALPTARTYQDYLQLVPGVQATIGGSNPASRSGINYSDILGTIGDSSDNFYYFEGINVTDNVTGTFGANLNTEIIQEQSVLTGGLPAEFVGATGLVSNVITKSGGNNFSGSFNYYFQDDSLVADNKNNPDSTFSRFDTAVTLGGPIVKDKAWFFASARILGRDDDVTNEDGEFLRTSKTDEDQRFGKITWAITQSDLVSALYLDDPFSRDGSRNFTTTNARDFVQEQGGERYSLNYSRVWSALVFDAAYSNHEGKVDQFPSSNSPAGSRVTLTFLPDVPNPAAALTQAGGFGIEIRDQRQNDTLRASLEYLASTSWGDHTLKFGYEDTHYENIRNNLTLGDGASYTSLPTRYLGQGVTAADVTSGTTVDFNFANTSDLNGFIASVNSSPNRQAIYDVLDTNHDGTISSAEVGANLVYDNQGVSPGGFIAYDRTLQTTDGLQETASDGTTFYLQDNWQFGRFSLNVGVRTEEWDHFATDGVKIYTFEREYAPRISAVYDLKGDGRQRISAYYGRYYDPIRNNMTNFAGSVTGRVREEQTWVQHANGGEWITYRTRGGPAQPDAFFAPTTQTPYTEEATIGYKIDLGRNQSFEVNYINRKTNDILEDYDLRLYAEAASYGLPVNDPDSLFLGLGYFGYSDFPVDGNGNEANFIIATLARGERSWDGVELVYRKRLSNHWQALASYNYADANGNTNSDSNADFQGDVLWLDPGAPNQDGTQPGLVEHLFKVAANYQWDNGLQVGGTYRWNSGVIASRTFRASSRNLPIFDFQDSANTPGNPSGQDVDPIFFAGGDGFGTAGDSGGWLSPFAVGQFENDSYGTLDLRLAYLWRIGGRVEADFFIDVFNALDDQATTQSQDLVLGRDGVAFGEGLSFVDPRRFFLGARLRF